MPKIQQHTVIDVTPEKYLDACDSTDLHELELLLNSPTYQQKMGRNVYPNAKVVLIPESNFRIGGGSTQLYTSENVCYQCGCTDMDCTACIDRTGEPCHWVAPNLCSACVLNSPLSK